MQLYGNGVHGYAFCTYDVRSAQPCAPFPYSCMVDDDRGPDKDMGAGKGNRAGDAGKGDGKGGVKRPHSRHERRKILEGIRGDDPGRKELYVAGGQSENIRK